MRSVFYSLLWSIQSYHSIVANCFTISLSFKLTSMQTLHAYITTIVAAIPLPPCPAPTCCTQYRRAATTTNAPHLPSMHCAHHQRATPAIDVPCQPLTPHATTDAAPSADAVLTTNVVPSTDAVPTTDTAPTTDAMPTSMPHPPLTCVCHVRTIAAVTTT
jgi:hypothetical protein